MKVKEENGSLVINSVDNGTARQMLAACSVDIMSRPEHFSNNPNLSSVVGHHLMKGFQLRQGPHLKLNINEQCFLAKTEEVL